MAEFLIAVLLFAGFGFAIGLGALWGRPAIRPGCGGLPVGQRCDGCTVRKGACDTRRRPGTGR